MVTGFYYSIYVIVAIAICVATIGHGRMAVNASENRTVSADVSESQIAVVTIREEPYFLIRFLHAIIVIADAVMTLVNQEDSLQVQQPVVVKHRIDYDKTDISLRSNFFRLMSMREMIDVFDCG